MGNELTGAITIAGLKANGTFGTAATFAAGDQLNGWQITHSENAEALQIPPIGSGDIMASNVDRGGIAPSLGLSGPVRYNAPEWTAIAQTFGGASVMSMGDSAYCHSILVNETANQKFFTVAFQANQSPAGSFEYPSCVGTKVTMTYPSPTAYLTAQIDALANKQVIADQQNTYTTLSAITAANNKAAVWGLSDDCRINEQAAADLGTSDRYCIASAVFTFNRPQEHAKEACGTGYLGVPVSTGDFPLSATLTVTFRTLQELRFFTAAQAGTEYKARLTHTGSIIGGSKRYFIELNLPRLKIIQSPEYNITTSGNNPATITFQCLKAASAPTGMIDTYPYFRIQNDKTTSFLA